MAYLKLAIFLAEYVTFVVDPAQIEGVAARLLGIQCGVFWEGICCDKGCVLAVRVGEYQRVELTILLDGIAAVDGKHVAFEVKNGVGAGDFIAV